jgi:hypothetical protein
MLRRNRPLQISQCKHEILPLKNYFTAAIRNLCATSWYNLCSELLLETVFKYLYVYCVEFIICRINVLSLKYLLALISAFNMNGRGRLRSVSPSTIFSLLTKNESRLIKSPVCLSVPH